MFIDLRQMLHVTWTVNKKKIQVLEGHKFSVFFSETQELLTGEIPVNHL